MGGWSGPALMAALALGCCGGQGQDGDRGRLVTEIHPDAVVHRRPRFISLAPRLAREGEPYQYGVSALDPDGEEVHLVLVRAPEGAVLEGTLLEWTPRHAQAGRPQRFTLRAVDRYGAGEQRWTVIPRAGDQSP